MEVLANLGQAIAVIAACWAIISGVDAWKREYIGKRKLELAEDALALFFEIKDTIAHIRSPFSNTEEGKSRKRSDRESPAESELLDRGYIVFERYESRKSVFIQFSTLKYRFMATFGSETEKIFSDTNKTLNSIFIAARLLATHYWPRQGRVHMTEQEFEKHLDDMNKHEGVFWDMLNDEDEIRSKLETIQNELEKITKPCFEETMRSYTIFTKRLNKNG
jgi:hypothetical protein